MFNQASIQAVDSARWGREGRFTRPLPGTYSFDQLPRLIRSLFAGGDQELQTMLLGPLAGTYDKVVLLFVDGFGWRFFEQYKGVFPFLSRFIQEGYVTKLTSQFPSTTSAHITTIHAGLPLGQSGIYEWYMYEPQVDDIIKPLPFSYAADKKSGTLIGKLEPRALLPQLRSTLYEQLGELGVRSFSLGHRSYTPSPYGSVIQRGAHLLPYESLDEAIDTLSRRLRSDPSPAYYCLYWGEIDGAGHDYGPESRQFRAQVHHFMTLAEAHLQEALVGSKAKTLLLMTADHGQVEVSLERMICLDRDLPEIKRHIKTNRQGKLLAPAGAPRDMFLHIRDGHLDEALALLNAYLEGKAETYRLHDLIAEGFFGPDPPSEMFMRRVGDLAILPYEGEQIWWWGERGEYVLPFKGHHGGLTPQEMETVLLARTGD